MLNSKRIAIFGSLLVFAGTAPAAEPSGWNPQAAATYLDGRAEWWSTWPLSARDHGTFCISCHTAAPYALGRPALRSTLAEKALSPQEVKLRENVLKRVRLWKEVEPFYPDQIRGLPKTSESRGTESILDALVLVSADARTGHLSADARLALDNMWALQLKSGDMNGSWAWLQFHNAPWEGDSQFYGTAMAALVVGTAPDGYAAEAGIQGGIKSMKAWLLGGMSAQTPADRAVLLWASAKLPNLLTAEQQKAIADELMAKQVTSGGFSMSTLVGGWKRRDDTPLDVGGDGYATGLVAVALQQSHAAGSGETVKRALAWLRANQEKSDGRWNATSLNKKRELGSDAGLFMSDAATAYAALALEGGN